MWKSTGMFGEGFIGEGWFDTCETIDVFFLFITCGIGIHYTYPQNSLVFWTDHSC